MPDPTAVKRKRDTEHVNNDIPVKKVMTREVNSGDSGIDAESEDSTSEGEHDTDEASNIDRDVTDSLDDEQDENTDSEVYNAFEEFKWLKPIDFRIKRSDDPDSPQLGYCTAKLIDREPIRATFHRDMEEPTHGTASFGFDVFDRWGNLKSELQHHPLKRGTGVWGAELNIGRVLLIEDISVDEDYRRQGFGRKAFNEVWERAQRLSAVEDEERIAARKKRYNELWKRTGSPSEEKLEQPDDFGEKMEGIFLNSKQPTTQGCDFAVIWATTAHSRDDEKETETLSESEKQAYYTSKQEILEDFWRALGFRRIGSSPYFGFAKDPTHASRLLASHEDYRRPAALEFDAHVDAHDFPQDEALISTNDSDMKKMLGKRLETHPATEASWLSNDREGSNILHIAARDYKAECVSWLLAMPFAASLKIARNLQGETPLELLAARLETLRAYRVHGMMRVVMYDLFAGHTPNQVACLSQLKGFARPSAIESLRLTFGCTCTQCIGGFLSPRTAFAIECQANIHHDMLDDDVFTSSGTKWCEFYDDMLEHVHPAVKSNMRTNKSLRQGFVNIFAYIAETLRAKLIPTARNVLHFADREWPPCTKNYLQRGGTVLAVLQACFDYAIEHDVYLGDGHHEECSQNDIDKLPACRNDREFVFARRQISKLEGLPDEVDPRWGMGGIW